MNSLLQATQLNVVRQGKQILQNIDITIGINDFITIIGPNGAGKSMLLKCLMGFYKPDSGKIKRQKNLKIGYVPQRLVSDNTIPINVERFLKIRNAVSLTTLQQITQETKIDNLLTKPLASLSGGEMQRVLLTRALLNNPNLLILDEPAQNLDISGQIYFYKLLDRIYQERKLSILMVSHDLHMVMASSQQVICLFHHICCSGEPQIITQDPEFISLFGNDMAHMMALYQHSHNHQHRRSENA
ncbi:MAG: ATP-binding cassette domain-containing protein [Gammaproteobacteria bacterium]|nr:ATP-binding cassette domain-containing protein [Gammaproteobacteria bacterium]